MTVRIKARFCNGRRLVWELTSEYGCALERGEITVRRVIGAGTFYDQAQYGDRFPQERLCKPQRTWLRNFTEVETL